MVRNRMISFIHYLMFLIQMERGNERPEAVEIFVRYWTCSTFRRNGS